MIIKPNPSFATWGAPIGKVQSVNIKGNEHLWTGFYKKKLTHARHDLQVDVFLETCPDDKTFSFYQGYLVTGDGYYIEVRQISSTYAMVWIYAKTMRGYYYAYLSWCQMQVQTLKEGMILDQPKMRIRGIVEGYYGKPWSFAQRKRAIEVIAEQKMNTYVYAPKNDRYHRDQWRIPYPEPTQRELGQLIAECSEHHVDFVYSISPGSTVCYSSVRDRGKLVGKLMQVYRQGVRCFGLFFDDIPQSLLFEQDKKEFADLAEAQIFLIQNVFAELKKTDVNIKLVVCPTLYYGEGNEEYITKWGRALPEEIVILWTGRRICSPEITAREARLFYEQNHHRPLYWDNYPVNDANMRDELHIGPLVNRDPKLFLYSEGLIANVMEQAEASLIPLITIAHYLWNPERYDPNDSFSYAVKNIVGDKEQSAFVLISDCINQSSLSPLPGNDLISQWWLHQRTWQECETKEQFRMVVSHYQTMARALLDMENVRLREEIKPWVKQVSEDLEYLQQILAAVCQTDPEQREKELGKAKEWAAARYNDRAKALGFIPFLIASEMLAKEEGE